MSKAFFLVTEFGGVVRYAVLFSFDGSLPKTDKSDEFLYLNETITRLIECYEISEDYAKFPLDTLIQLFKSGIRHKPPMRPEPQRQKLALPPPNMLKLPQP